MNYKLIVIIGLLVSMLWVTGCKGNNDKPENVNEETTEVVATETITEEHFHKDYVWKELNKYAAITEQEKTFGGNNKTIYGCLSVNLTSLFDDDDIAEIEYFIEDGNGYFMDKVFSTMSEEQLDKQMDTITKPEENRYSCTLEEQKDVYFSVYYNLDSKLETQQNVTLKSNLVRKLSVVVNLKYKDGTKEQHRYAFDFSNSHSYKNADIYELIKE